MFLEVFMEFQLLFILIKWTVATRIVRMTDLMLEVGIFSLSVLANQDHVDILVPSGNPREGLAQHNTCKQL